MSAEFYALTEATGLTPSYWAGRLGVSETTAQQWTTPHADPPRAVIDTLDAVLTWQHEKLALLRSVAEQGQRVWLMCFADELDFIAVYGDSLPWLAYERLISLAYADLRVAHLPAVLHTFDAQAFHQWRGDRPDTPELRAHWLATMGDPAGDLAAADSLIVSAFDAPERSGDQD